MSNTDAPYQATYTRDAIERSRNFDTAGEALGFLLTGVERDTLAPIAVTTDTGQVVFDEATIWALAEHIDAPKAGA